MSIDRAVADRVAEAYALGPVRDGPTLAARGEQGRMWRLTTERGRWAVKELLMPQTEAAAQADVAFQVLAHDAGLPLPQPIRRPDGAVLMHAETSGGDPLEIRVYEWVDLARPDRPASIEVGGALLGRLHALDRPADGPIDEWFADPVGADGWDALATAGRRADAEWLPILERAIAAGIEAEPIVVEARLANLPTAALRRCHLDYNIDNVLSDVTGAAVIVDWENSGSAPDAGELVAAATDFAPDADGAVAFVRAYRTAGGTAEVRDASSFALAIAVQNHLLRYYGGGAANPKPSDEDRARFIWRLGQIAENLLTVGRIEELVRALRSI